MYGSTVTKYKFLFISLASISIPFLEFINFNLNNLEPSQFKTLVYTMVFFIFFLFFFSFIFSILFRKNFFEIFFVCAIATYISFNYDKLKLLIISLLIKNTSFTFVGELSLILVFIIVITIVLFFFNKKNSPFFNFIYIYIIVLFIINAAGIAYNKKKLNEIPYQKAFSDEVYFTDDEVKKILDSNNNKNIYYIIVDNAIPLKQYSNNFRKIDEKKIISDFKKLNFNYIADVVPSYSATSIANAQIFNLNYFINEDSPTRPYYTVYPYIMSQFKKSPLGKTLEKINYDFFWVGNARMHCTYYNVFLCMPAKKKENLFKSIMPNILHKINTNYVLLSFLQKSPIVDFLSKLFSGKLDKNSVKEIAYIENDAIKKFIKFSKDLEINNKKNHFVFIHSLLPAPYFVPKDDPLVFNADCSLRTLSKNLQLFLEEKII